VNRIGFIHVTRLRLTSTACMSKKKPTRPKTQSFRPRRLTRQLAFGPASDCLLSRHPTVSKSVVVQSTGFGESIKVNVWRRSHKCNEGS
jgi:hypothetical protein